MGFEEQIGSFQNKMFGFQFFKFKNIENFFQKILFFVFCILKQMFFCMLYFFFIRDIFNFMCQRGRKKREVGNEVLFVDIEIEIFYFDNVVSQIFV